MAGKGDIEAGRAFVRLYTKDGGLLSGVKAGLKTVAVGVAGVAAGVAAAGAAAGAGIAVALNHFANFGSELNDMSARTGVAAGALAEMKFAAEQTGSGIDDVEKAMKTFVKGGGDIKNFDATAEAIAAIKDPSERSRQALEVFGKTGTKLLPMFAEMKSLRSEAKSLGLAPSDEDVAMADALGDSFSKLKVTLGASLFKIGAAFAPVVQPAIEAMVKLVAQFNQWISTNNVVVETLKSIGSAMSGGQWQLAGQIAIKSLQLAFLQGLDFIADAIGGTLGGALGDLGTRVIMGDFAGAWQTAVAGMASLWANFSNGVVTVFTSAAKAVADKWAATVNSLAKGMLKKAGEGGVIGKLMSGILGVDVAAAKRENDRIDALRGIKQDPFDLAFSSIDDSTKNLAEPIKKFLDSMAATAQSSAETADAALQETFGKGPNSAIATLQQELAELRNKAAEAKESAKSPTVAGPEGDDAEFGKTKASIATSAAAAFALQFGGGGGPQERIARGVESHNKKLDTLIELQKEQLTKTKPQTLAP